MLGYDFHVCDDSRVMCPSGTVRVTNLESFFTDVPLNTVGSWLGISRAMERWLWVSVFMSGRRVGGWEKGWRTPQAESPLGILLHDSSAHQLHRILRDYPRLMSVQAQKILQQTWFRQMCFCQGKRDR